MKKLLLSILLGLSFGSFAQNYNCFTPNTLRHFINSDTVAYFHGGYLRCMFIDSVRRNGSDTLYYPFHSVRGKYGSGLPGLDTNGGSWLGKKVVQKPDGTFLFDNYWGDTVIIKTKANVGDTWMLYNDTTNWYYAATVISKGVMNILGAIDSVKNIKITAYRGGHVNAGDPLNNGNIILSKYHGFARVCDLYMFPIHAPDTIGLCRNCDFYTNVSLGFGASGSYTTPNNYNLFYSLVSYTNPEDSTTNIINAGDVFEYKYYGGPITRTTLDSFGKSVNGIYERYTLWQSVFQQTYFQGKYLDTFYKTVSYWNDTLRPGTGWVQSSVMPENYHHRPGLLYYLPDDSSWCYKSSLYSQAEDFISGGGNMPGSVQVGTFEPCGSDGVTKSGFEGIRNDQCFDPSVGGTSNFLIYAHKIGHPACGNFEPLSVKSISLLSNQVSIFPNPSTDQLFVKVPVGISYSITLFNSLGQVMYSHANCNGTEEVDTHAMPTGIYVVMVTDINGNRSNHKVIVQH